MGTKENTKSGKENLTAMNKIKWWEVYFVTCKKHSTVSIIKYS